MAQIVSNATGEEFVINNPFLFQTKAQMCQIVKTDPKLLSLAFQTVTCDKKPHKKIRQCGICTSCLLRRHALAAAGITDRTRYIVMDPKQENKYLELKAMAQQCLRLENLLSSDNPWSALCSEYLTFRDIEARFSVKEKRIPEKILNLYRTYVSELGKCR